MRLIREVLYTLGFKVNVWIYKNPSHPSYKNPNYRHCKYTNKTQRRVIDGTWETLLPIVGTYKEPLKTWYIHLLEGYSRHSYRCAGAEKSNKTAWTRAKIILWDYPYGFATVTDSPYKPKGFVS